MLPVKIPEIIGFLITGILIGPHGVGVFTNMHDIDYLAEIGVVLLLFTIGLEFSFRNLLDLKKQLLIGGILQAAIISVAAYLISRVIGLPQSTSILIGFMLTPSSTAIVVRLLQDRDKIDSIHGRVIMGMIIFDDILSVPMMLTIPFLAGSPGDLMQSVTPLIVAAIGIILLVIIGTLWVAPRVLHNVARTRSNELFVLCI